MFIMFSLCAWQHAQVARRRGQVQHLQPEERAAVGRGGGRHQARPRLLRGKAEGKYGVRPRLLRGESQRGKGAGVEGLKKTHKLKINKSEPMMIKLTTPPITPLTHNPNTPSPSPPSAFGLCRLTFDHPCWCNAPLYQ